MQACAWDHASPWVQDFATLMAAMSDYRQGSMEITARFSFSLADAIVLEHRLTDLEDSRISSRRIRLKSNSRRKEGPVHSVYNLGTIDLSERAFKTNAVSHDRVRHNQDPVDDKPTIHFAYVRSTAIKERHRALLARDRNSAILLTAIYYAHTRR